MNNVRVAQRFSVSNYRLVLTVNHAESLINTK